ncbi:transglycosylase domain-containing protein [Haloferula chungangensis]|uniref:peptidoglycan glycosyltransferase n=1 Tax=Haloferula chungangensis TaxID=1048331 RepID=A0ABW2L292_9BACT
MSTWRPASRFPKWLSWIPDWCHAPLIWMLRLGIAALIAFLAVAFFYFLQSSKFDLDEVAAIPARTTILDRNGTEIEVAWGSNRRLARRQDLPDFMIQCLEAREDARFYEHNGVDFRGLARATIRNIKDRDFTQGASTLSMQLARNTFEMRAKSIHRKLLEIALTLRIEQRYSKDEILTHYLNRIYFGAGCHGIEEASRSYFGKSVSQLDKGQIAMLIGIIRGPHLFSPTRNLPGARAQQDEVLDRMIAMGRIDEAEKKRIEALPIKLVPSEHRSSERSYALHAIREELAEILETSDIRLDGLIVHTTLATDWQLRLETDLSEALSEAEKAPGWDKPTHAGYQSGETPEYLQCAAVTLESETGSVLALIGGRDFLHSRLDRTVQARRDLGTVIEPWIAAAAAERGKRVIPGNPLLTGRQIGPAETERIIKRCGIGGPFLTTEDLFRGGVASTPMELATALTTLVSNGKRPQPFLIQKISNADGKTLFTRQTSRSQAISSNAAKEASSILKQVAGTRSYTGATGSGRDAWLLRVGPTGSTVVWLGFDSPERIAKNPHIDKILDDLVKRLGNN